MLATDLPALRDEAWLAASYSCGGLSMPFDAESSDETFIAQSRSTQQPPIGSLTAPSESVQPAPED